MKEMENQIKALQNQVRFLLNKVGKLPVKTESPWGEVMTGWATNRTIILQELSTHGCHTLNEWLEVTDTKRLVPGHTLVFRKQLVNSLVLTTYLYGWEQLEQVYHRVRHHHPETMRQWKRNMCPQDWLVKEKIHLPIKEGSND